MIGKRNITNEIKLCKPYSSDDLQNCKTINLENGKCDACEDGYYLGLSDKKWTKTEYCDKSLNGECQKCHFYYYLDKNKCILGIDNFLNCKISNDGIKCDECIDVNFFDDEGKCIDTKFCSKSKNLKCDKCKDGYYLSRYRGACTTEKNCEIGRGDIGLCTLCSDEFYIDFKDGKCKSNKENNDQQYCRIFDGKCTKCIIDFYLTQQDQKCCNSPNCLKSENGICTQCINDYF